MPRLHGGRSVGAMPTITANGVRLYVEEHGDGDPILCIHGAGSTALMWTQALPALARLGRVIAYDRRGCTRSERPDRYLHTSVAEQAADAAALLDSLAAAPAVVIGRSYGGTVAIELALRYPGRVRALVLLEADATGISPTGLKWTKAIADRLRAVAVEEGIDAVYRTLIDEVAGERAWESFPEQIQRTLTENGPALLAEIGFVDEQLPDASALATIDKPTLLVAADESPGPQREMTEALAGVLPDARLVRVPGGHLIDPAGPEVLAFVAAHAGVRRHVVGGAARLGDGDAQRVAHGARW
jgi:esterase